MLMRPHIFNAFNQYEQGFRYLIYVDVYFAVCMSLANIYACKITVVLNEIIIRIWICILCLYEHPINLMISI